MRVRSLRPASSKGATPCEVVYEEGKLKLLRYRNDSVKFAEPILICFALVNRPYILDLKEDRSVVRRLLDRGFDVYLIDWGVPGEADSQLRLEDYICSMLSNVVEFVCDRHGHTAAESARLLHGRHDVDHVHRAAAAARPQPDLDGDAD